MDEKPEVGRDLDWSCPRCGKPTPKMDNPKQAGRECAECHEAGQYPRNGYRKPIGPGASGTVEAAALSGDETDFDMAGALHFPVGMSGQVYTRDHGDAEPGERFFSIHFLAAPDGRWFARGGYARSMDNWRDLIRLGRGEEAFVEVDPDHVRRFMRRRGIPRPDLLNVESERTASPHRAGGWGGDDPGARQPAGVELAAGELPSGWPPIVCSQRALASYCGKSPQPRFAEKATKRGLIRSFTFVDPEDPSSPVCPVFKTLEEHKRAAKKLDSRYQDGGP